MKKYIFVLLMVAIVVGKASAQPQFITVTIAGNGFSGYAGDGGAAKRAKLYEPFLVTRDARGNIYLANNSLIRKIAAKNGIITTIGGGGTRTAVGVPATSVVISPSSIISDPVGNLYIATGSQVKKIDAVTNLITNFAGTGASGYGGDGGPATAGVFGVIASICMDYAGNIYVVDALGARIRKITAGTNILTTVAGTGVVGYSGDGGPATMARLSSPKYICTNPAGYIYFTDQGEGKIRKINVTTGIITAFAGSTGGRLFGCHALSCYLGPVSGICHDGGSNIYFNEMSCSLRRIDERTDSVYAVAGDFAIESFRNDTVSLYAWMNFNYGICPDEAKNMYVADKRNNRIRKIIQLSHVPSFAFGEGQYITPCPGFVCPIDPLLWVADLDSAQTETWTVVSAPIHGTLSGFPTTTLSNGIHETVKPSGVYYSAPPTYLGADSFRVRVFDGFFADTITIYVSVQTLSGESITGASTFCPGQTSTLSATTSGGIWSATNPTVNINITTGGVTAVSAGIDTIIYTVSPYCPDIITKVVTVNPMPISGPITGADTVCLGGSITLSGATPGGTWTTSSICAAIGSATGSVSGISTGSSVIRYMVSSLGCTSVATKTIRVFSPIPGVISGPDTVCVGATIPLISTVSGGVWSAISPFAAIDTLGNVSGLSVGNDTIAYTITGGPGCLSKTTFVINVTNGFFVDPGVITGPDSVCPGATIILANTATGGIWNSTNGNATISGSGAVTGALPGLDTINYSVFNSCNWISASKTINIKPFTSAGVISGFDTVCKHSSIILTSSVPNGMWSSSNASGYITALGVMHGKFEGIDTIKYLVIDECGVDVVAKEVVIVKCRPDGTGIILQDAAISIFPNPTSDVLTIKSSKDIYTTFTISNALGQQLLQSKLDGTQTKADVSLLPPGLYYITLKGELESGIEKFVKL